MAAQPSPAPGSRRSAADECCIRINGDSLHELLSPVNQIGTISELIAQKYKGTLDAEAETLFGYIAESVERLRNLTGGLRTFIREAGAPAAYQYCGADALLNTAEASLQPEIDECGVTVTHDPLPEVYCDPIQIHFVLASLLENAVKFRGQEQLQIHVSARDEQNGWMFSVRDNGIGIGPAHRERIFGLFKRVYNEGYPGAGVGLAIARQIVEQHGGRIWVESEPGAGATFFFTLPRP